MGNVCGKFGEHSKTSKMTALSFSTKSHKSLDCSNRPHVTADSYRRGGTHKRPIELVGDTKYHDVTVRLYHPGKEKGPDPINQAPICYGSGGWI